ncbi:mucin-3B-like [Mytilus trossulus]|uniref:mucin-3B-like n=1 Tax=Mytilus trossulus TaxID=6551 RepID=UPI0030063D90
MDISKESQTTINVSKYRTKTSSSLSKSTPYPETTAITVKSTETTHPTSTTMSPATTNEPRKETTTTKLPDTTKNGNTVDTGTGQNTDGNVNPPMMPNVQSCDKQNLLKDLAKRSVLRSVNDTKCLSGESVLSHAVVLARCAAPDLSSWKRGVQVSTYCGILPSFIAVAQFRQDVLIESAVLVSCDKHNDSLQILSQPCDGSIRLRNVTWPITDTYYTVEWRV